MTSERVVIYDLQISYGVQYEGKGYTDMPLGRHSFTARYLPEPLVEQLQAFVQRLEEARRREDP